MFTWPRHPSRSRRQERRKPLEGHPPTEERYLLRGCRHIHPSALCLWSGHSAHQAGRGSLLKAFYDRPLNYSSFHQWQWTGNRNSDPPSFSLLSELTNVIQPLSGGTQRGAVLETIPFPIGYGVETSHLLDLYEKFGLEAFTQTVGSTGSPQSNHKNALGKMSFGILQTFINRLHSQGKIDQMPDMETFHRRSKSRTEPTTNSSKSWKKKDRR